MCICSSVSRNDGLLTSFNCDSVTYTAVFMSAVQDMKGVDRLGFVAFNIAYMLFKS